MDPVILAADATGGFDLTGPLTTTAAEITAQIGDVLPIALPVAGGLIALTVGWRLFKRFAKA